MLWTVTGYGVMLAATVVVALLVSRYGETLYAPAVGPLLATPDAPAAAAGHSTNILLAVLGALAAVIAVGLALGRLCAWVGQPPVIGEVVAGILLGPSLLGAELSAVILPPDAAPYLGMIAQLGVMLYMFTVGLELDVSYLRHRAHATVATSHSSIIVPFVLGMLLALALYPRLSTSDVPFTSFALFIGVAMAITAFPVLARILDDRGILRTELGVIALSCAATDDVTAWCLLAFVVGVANAQVGAAVCVAAGTALFILLILLVVRPVLRRFIDRWENKPLPRPAQAFLYVLLLLSAWSTEWIGIHAIFGAFLLGAVIPQQSNVAQTLHRQLEGVVPLLLLPAFFAYTGMRTRIDLVQGWEAWVICGVIIVTATAGKFGGTFVAARLTGLNTRRAAALGALMNTRGLMELIVLNIGLDLGIISPELFAMMVIMALVTTMTTAPVLNWLVATDKRDELGIRTPS